MARLLPAAHAAKQRLRSRRDPRSVATTVSEQLLPSPLRESAPDVIRRQRDSERAETSKQEGTEQEHSTQIPRTQRPNRPLLPQANHAVGGVKSAREERHRHRESIKVMTMITHGTVVKFWSKTHDRKRRPTATNGENATP
jgi:hypothetical protein